MTYVEALAYLEGLNTFGIKLGLVRIKRLLALMDQPQERYKTIHVTGSNGKGSTTAMLAGILSEAKIKTGMYTSPHLVKYTERMQIDQQEITEEAFAECIYTVKQFVDQMLADGEESPTQFEVITAAAFYYFAKMQVEYAVIEVGLGGLLDSTNVIIPEVSVITNVTFEHADRCGGTLSGIAEHKAGIIKDGVPVITAAKGDTLEIIRSVAAQKCADIFVAGEDFSSEFASVTEHKQNLTFSAELVGVAILYHLRLLGTYQIENSAVAIMTALVLANSEKRITTQVIQVSMAKVSWGGRFEILQDKETTIVVDGAHNLAGTKALRKNLDQYFAGREIVFLLGILKDKDVDGMLESLISPEDIVVVSQPDSQRAATPTLVARKVQAKQVEVYEVIKIALARAKELAGSEKLLCVAGSLYLIGEARRLLLNTSK